VGFPLRLKATYVPIAIVEDAILIRWTSGPNFGARPHPCRTRAGCRARRHPCHSGST